MSKYKKIVIQKSSFYNNLNIAVATKGILTVKKILISYMFQNPVGQAETTGQAGEKMTDKLSAHLWFQNYKNGAKLQVLQNKTKS